MKGPMQPPQLHLDANRQGQVIVRLSGSWTIRSQPPDPEEIFAMLDPAAGHLAFTADALEAWDTRLLIFLKALLARARTAGLEVSLEGLPAGVRDLLVLAAAVPEQSPGKTGVRENLLTRIGQKTLHLWAQLHEIATLVRSSSPLWIYSPESGPSNPAIFLPLSRAAGWNHCRSFP